MLIFRAVRGTFAKTFFFQLSALGLALVCSASSVKTFQIQGKATVRLNVPADWQDVKDLMNAPLTLLGPERKGIRPVINFVPTGISASTVDEATFKSDLAKWQKGRRAFLKQEGGVLLEFYPSQDESWKSGTKAHIYGYRYQLGDAEIVSRSYYIECKSKYFLAKSVVRAENEAEFGPVVSETLRSFSCE